MKIVIKGTAQMRQESTREFLTNFELSPGVRSDAQRCWLDRSNLDLHVDYSEEMIREKIVWWWFAEPRSTGRVISWVETSLSSNPDSYIRATTRIKPNIALKYSIKRMSGISLWFADPLICAKWQLISCGRKLSNGNSTAK
jgi:hypothetical protein